MQLPIINHFPCYARLYTQTNPDKICGTTGWHKGQLFNETIEKSTKVLIFSDSYDYFGIEIFLFDKMHFV